MKTVEKDTERKTKGRVLIIDDEPDIITYLSTLLEENGFESVSAREADEGMRAALETKPDLVCLDIMMPKKTGLALFKALREEPKLRNTPALIVSAFSRNKDLSAAQLAEIFAGDGISPPEGYIEKPIDRKSFVETVERIIQARSR